MWMKPSVDLVLKIKVDTPDFDSLLNLRSQFYGYSAICVNSNNCIRIFISRLKFIRISYQFKYLLPWLIVQSYSFGICFHELFVNQYLSIVL